MAAVGVEVITVALPSYHVTNAVPVLLELFSRSVQISSTPGQISMSRTPSATDWKTKSRATFVPAPSIMPCMYGPSPVSLISSPVPIHGAPMSTPYWKTAPPKPANEPVFQYGVDIDL